MRKFLIKIGLLILAISGLFIWFRTDAAVLAGANALGMDDSSGWIAANSQKPEVMDTLEAANAGMLRVELPWNAVELSPGAFSWTVEGEYGTTDFSALFSRLQRRGIQPVIVLTGGPGYLSHLYPQQPVYRDQLLESWSRYVSAAVEQFGEQVHYWQIGAAVNGPEYWGELLFPGADAPQAAPDPVLYGDMLSIAYNAIKGERASHTVILGSLSFSADCAAHPNNYLQTLADQGSWYAFDTVSLRLPILNDAPEEALVDYCGIMPLQLSGIPAADSIKAVADFIDAEGIKPVWIQNLQFDKQTLQDQADMRGTIYEVAASDYMARASAIMRGYGHVERVFWAFDPLENIPGLLALQTYRNLSHTISGNYDGSAIPVSADRVALRFRGDGKLSLIAWYTHTGSQAEPIMLNGMQGYTVNAFSSDSDSLKAKNGIELPVDDGGNIALLLSERPVLISGRPADIKAMVTQTVSDSAAQASAGMQAKLNNWLQAQKARAAARVSEWVAEQQASLLDSLRASLEDWLRKSLGLA